MNDRFQVPRAGVLFAAFALIGGAISQSSASDAAAAPAAASQQPPAPPAQSPTRLVVKYLGVAPSLVQTSARRPMPAERQVRLQVRRRLL
jgi:hypothetical protein